jgi:hypothetical protein
MGSVQRQTELGQTGPDLAADDVAALVHVAYRMYG